MQRDVEGEPAGIESASAQTHRADTATVNLVPGTWSWRLLGVAALVVGLLAIFLGDPQRVSLGWFAPGGQTGFASHSIEALYAFGTALLLVSLATTAVGVLTTAKWGVLTSAAQGNAYIAFVETATLVSGLVVLPVSAWCMGLPTLLIVVLAVAPVSAVVLYGARASSPGRASSNGLFVFYSLYSLRNYDDGGQPRGPTHTRFLHDPGSGAARALSLAVPIFLTSSWLLTAALILTFGLSLLAKLDGLLGRLQLESGSGNLTGLVDAINAIPIQGLLVLGITVLLAGLHRWFHSRLASPGRVVLIRLGYAAHGILFATAMVITGVNAIVGGLPAPAHSATWPWSLIVLATTFAAFAATVLHQSEAIADRLIARIHGLRTRRFWINTGRYLDRFPQPREPVGYLFFSTLADTYSVASSLLILCRLRQLGWKTIIMDRWPIGLNDAEEGHLARFSAIKLGSQRVLNFDWEINWPEKTVKAAGLNLYHPIWEGLSRHFGRYTLDLSTDPEAHRIFQELLVIADATLLNCFRILNTVSGHGKPVRILGSSAQFVPNAVYNIYCREIGKHRDMHFVWLQQGYQTYYQDKGRLSKRISLQNMTRKWPYSNPYLPHTDDFEAWIAKGQDVEAIMLEAQGWIDTNRATDREDMSVPAREAYTRIVAHRDSGKPVILILGKMVFDLSTPWERGPAHSGMFDWINHTMEVAKDAPEVLVVVKPHPYESRPEIAGVVEQYFSDMIEATVPENVLILAHDWFNLHSLFPFIDLGVMWNGTSGLELGVKSIPVVMCSDWGPIDYPIGFPTPSNREDYERIIKNPRSVAVPENYEERCALLLKYTSTDEVMIPYDYCARPLTNEPFGPPYWYEDQVERFMTHGDPNIDRACERIL